jgi:hypothetical protein
LGETSDFEKLVSPETILTAPLAFLKTRYRFKEKTVFKENKKKVSKKKRKSKKTKIY